MPVYVYQCKKCLSGFSQEQLDKMDTDTYGQSVLFETIHSVKPSDKELKEAVVCPRCNDNDCEISFSGTKVHSYVRGYGWKDKAGARRDMNVFHLDNDDPYSNHRVPGEVEHIRSNLKKGGKRNPHTKIFVPKNTTGPDIK